MLSLKPETRQKLRHVANFALIGSTMTGVVIGRTDLPYDPRDVAGVIVATITAIWLFSRR